MFVTLITQINEVINLQDIQKLLQKNAHYAKVTAYMCIKFYNCAFRITYNTKTTKGCKDFEKHRSDA